MASNSGVRGPIHLRVLYEEGTITHDSIDKRMESLVTSMTSIIRTSGAHSPLTDGMSEVAKGTMWITTTCVYIRWRCITFPAVIIGLIGVFLLLVALENRGIENDRMWKSSFLAALFCEVEVHETPVGKQEMKAVAKSSSASLEGKEWEIEIGCWLSGAIGSDKAVWLRRFCFISYIWTQVSYVLVRLSSPRRCDKSYPGSTVKSSLKVLTILLISLL
jgi:hypothetical protein